MLYSLSIFFGPSPVPAQFLFKNKTLAQDMAAAANKSTAFDIHDDFGQSATFEAGAVHAVILEDMDLGEESRIQRGLSQARGQANANKRAMADPVLSQSMRGQGPSVITPFGRN